MQSVLFPRALGMSFQKLFIRATAYLALLLCSLTLLSCDPEEEIHQYFADLGLNRLALVRTDLQPGSLILVGAHGPVYAGHLGSYTSAPDVLSTDSITEYEAVIGKYTGDRSLSASAAVSFVKGLFQFAPGADLDFSGRVHVDLIESHAERMEVDAIKKFLGSQEGQPFVQEVLEAFGDGERAFLAYEVHRAQRLQISSTDGSDLAPSLKAGTVGQLPLKGEANLSYKKVSDRELVLEGNRDYAFAVRTGELVPGLAANTVRFKVTNFLKPGYVKSVGTDDQYTSPVLDGYAPLTLGDQS
ncbi:MAG: hypothetical protein KC643_26895 [Nitrospira sp.]|nr:hypothetical protein [Nitrospira sp.]